MKVGRHQRDMKLQNVLSAPYIGIFDLDAVIGKRGIQPVRQPAPYTVPIDFTQNIDTGYPCILSISISGVARSRSLPVLSSGFITECNQVAISIVEIAGFQIAEVPFKYNTCLSIKGFSGFRSNVFKDSPALQPYISANDGRRKPVEAR